MGKKSKSNDPPVEGEATKGVGEVGAKESLSTFLTTKSEGLDDFFSISKGPTEAIPTLIAGNNTTAKGKKKKTGPNSKKEKSKSKKRAREDEEVDVESTHLKIEAEPEANDVEGVEMDAEMAGEEEAEEEAEVEDEYIKRARLAAARILEAQEKPKDVAVEKSKSKSKSGDKSLKKEESGEEDEDVSMDEEEVDIEDLDLDSEADEEDEDVMTGLGDINSLIQNTLSDSKQNSSKKSKKVKKVIEGETPEERDARTVFVGNVPVGASTKSSAKKAFIRHILTSPFFVSKLPPSIHPSIESIRFRSIAFSSKVFGRKDPEARSHAQKRVDAFKISGGAGGEGALRGVKGIKKGEKELVMPAKSAGMTEAQKRRVAFIKGDLNEGKKSCNAYIVFEPIEPVGEFTTQSLVDLVVEVTDGSIYESFTLRADHVRSKSSISTLLAAQKTTRPTDAVISQAQKAGAVYNVPAGEAKRTVFLGSLDFAESEENVRSAVEGVLVRERGVIEGDGESYVKGVRIIRDPSTGLGKGFGYVLLRDEECVDELLALPEGKPLKINKRKPRMERCKSGLAAARSKAASINNSNSSGSKNKGDGKPLAPRPTKKPRLSSAASAHQEALAEQLKTLDPEERKKVKAMDSDRVKRRMEKKRNKVLSERYERKQKGKGGVKGELGREGRRERRERIFKKQKREKGK